MWWVAVKLAVEPVEGLVSSYFLRSIQYLPSQMRTNGWRVELTLTARLTFLTDARGEMFDRTTPLRIRFPHKIPPACAVDAQIEDLDVSERV